jgi:hypothetical protein
MAPLTRSKARQTTPDRTISSKECISRTRVEFFRDYDTTPEDKDLRLICKLFGITEKTGRTWLKQRRELGSPAYHRTRKLSKNLGRNPRVLIDTI